VQRPMFMGSRFRGNDSRLMRCRHPLTRRAVLATGFGLAAAPARAGEPPATITQADAQYQPTPKGMFSCGVCTFFIKPNACKIVTGEISPQGWCKLFDLPD
jgi:hypothetical protein